MPDPTPPPSSTDVVVVGAGLCGLVAATHLQRAGRTCTVLEARDRIGGRIEGVAGFPSVDLGPAWVWPHHAHVLGQLALLGLATFPQSTAGDTVADQGPGRPVHRMTLPEQGPPPSRVMGGMTALVRELADGLAPGTVRLGHVVQSLAVEGAGVRVTSTDSSGAEHSVSADAVIVALPPALAARSLAFDPPLAPDRVRLMAHTPTWMAWSMKVAVVTPSAPWLGAGLSGAGLSRVGPAVQIYDATAPGADGPGALVGWAEPSQVRGVSVDERRRSVEAQVDRMFGPGLAPLATAERDWSTEPFTTVPDEAGYGSLDLYGHDRLRAPDWTGRLHLAGSETSAVSPGYLDGAVARGEEVARAIMAAR